MRFQQNSFKIMLSLACVVFQQSNDDFDVIYLSAIFYNQVIDMVKEEVMNKNRGRGGGFSGRGMAIVVYNNGR